MNGNMCFYLSEIAEIRTNTKLVDLECRTNVVVVIIVLHFIKPRSHKTDRRNIKITRSISNIKQTVYEKYICYMVLYFILVYTSTSPIKLHLIFIQIIEYREIISNLLK